jgi:glycosyltransferase involved in cell wall biosynthesis
MSAAEPRIALVCPGLGRERRGYERITGDLFRALHDDADVWLFKGGGESGPREIVPPSLARDGWVLMNLHLHRLIGRTRYHMECLTFALSAAPRLARGGFDVIFTYDPPMLKLLWWIRRLTGARYRILFAHGGAFPFRYWPHADVALHCSPLSYQEDVVAGVPPENFVLLPIGVFPERFATGATRAELRRKYQVPESTLLVLSVAALDRAQKRVHHLIEEVAKVEGDVMLWIDGSSNFAADLTLIDLAAEKLGKRCRITYGSSERVGELFAAADVMALASIREGFGLAVVEALVSGTPTLTHNSPHFEWLVGVPELMVDMAAPGALAARLQALVRNPGALGPFVNKAAFRRRYAWPSLKQRYLELFRRVARGESAHDV